MAKYKLSQPAFMAPRLLPEGTVFTIDDEWVPGPHCIPLDAAAEAAMDAYYNKHPEARLDPIEDLPNTMEVHEVETPVAEELALGLAEAANSKAKPGPTDGGKAT